MPYLVACPNCGAKLKSSRPIPVGRALACPHCKAQFTLADPAPEVVDQPTAAPAPPAPPPMPARPASAVKHPAAIPDALILDDPPDNRSRRPVGDIDFDDDRPDVKRTEYRDADDEYDRLRRRRRRAKKKGNGLLIGLIAGAVALLFLCGGGAVVYFDPFGLRRGPGSDEMLAWAPADSQSIIYVDADAARNVDDMHNDMLLTGDTNRFGIRSEDVSSVVGANRGGGGLFGLLGEPDVMAVKLNRSADRKGIIDACRGREATSAGKTYYQTQGGGGLYFASDRLVVIAKVESTLTGLLQKDAGKIVVSDDLKAATKRADGLIAVVSVGQAAQGSDILGVMAVQMPQFGPGGFNPAGPIVSGPVARATIMSMKVSGNKGTMRFETTYDSPESARRVADDLRRNLGQNRPAITDMESFNVTQSGSTVTLTTTGAVKKRKGFAPFGM